MFQIPFERGNMKLRFRAEINELMIYVSYEMKKVKVKHEEVKYEEKPV